jgi:succinyl-diaminopimelate desuccinylase
MSFAAISKKIDTYRDAVIELESGLTAIPALSPTYEAPPEQTGEARKVAFLKGYLSKLGISKLETIDAPDPTVPEGVRPSLIARLPGKSHERTLWIMAHTDVVPPGDLAKWESDPWKLRVDGDKIYGRGVEDNQQGLVSAVMVARALLEAGETPPIDLAILFVADEECGSNFGIKYVLEHANPFKPNDLIFVPDGGAPDGTEIEIAEKSIMWMKFQLTGSQCHASTPERGVNAMRAGAYLIVKLDEMLHREFGDSDPVFAPPTSTFEPTKKMNNVPAINIVPGDDVFYLDCRVLPKYKLADVLKRIDNACLSVEKELRVKVAYTFEQKEEAAPPTPKDAPIVGLLERAVKAVYGVDGKAVGIGGGTVAANLRREGLPCVVWSKMDETMHAPNENACISNILGDAKVLAHVLYAGK